MGYKTYISPFKWEGEADLNIFMIMFILGVMVFALTLKHMSGWKKNLI
jgi:hypothetical protein